MLLLKLRKLLRIIRSFYFLRALFRGVVAGVEHESVLKTLDCQFVLDVGANRGQFALISHYCLPQATIHSFEPLPGPAETFRAVFENNSRVILHQCAIGRVASSSWMHVTRDDDSSSLLPISNLQKELFPGSAEQETSLVKVFPLRLALGEVQIPARSLLKIDVQGYELEVLQGCEEDLSQFSHIYVECSFVQLYEGQALVQDIIAWLQPRNYILIGVYNLYYGREGLSLQGDFLFARKNSG